MKNRIQRAFLSSFIVFIAVIPIWHYEIVPELEKISSDFYFKAEMFSIDNFFDPENNVFKGEEISKSLLTFTVNSVQGDILLIDTVFDVKTLSGEPIYRVDKSFGVNAKTGENAVGYGDQNREGFFFFPKHAEKKSYRFSHYSYEEPVDLKFIGTEMLHDLEVYHYTGSVIADKTKSLSWEKDVPEKKRVIDEVQINIWIEPISGNFVKFKDSGENYYQDAKTNQKLFSRNKYSNILTNDTISLLSYQALHQKTRIYLYEQIIPMLLGTISLAFLITFIVSKKLELPVEE